jgi:hypothetical protein
LLSAGGRVEDQREELLRRVGGAGAEVGPVARSYLGVPEAVGGHRELDRDKGVVAPLEVLGAAREHVIDHRLAYRLGQELVEDEPLVMPAHHPLGLGEKLLGGVAGPQVGLDVGHHPVVEAHDGQVELGDDEVLVVARVAGDGDVLAVAGQVEPGRGVD